jgi:hypothetical protein
LIIQLFVQKEELQRQEKMKNLEKYGTILGRSSKTLVKEENNTLSNQVLGSKKKPEKSKLRPGTIDILFVLVFLLHV